MLSLRLSSYKKVWKEFKRTFSKEENQNKSEEGKEHAFLRGGKKPPLPTLEICEIIS